MKIEDRISAFVKLGNKLEQFLQEEKKTEINDSKHKTFEKFEFAVNTAGKYNPWFSRNFIINSIEAIRNMLTKTSIDTWLEKYNDKLSCKSESKKIAVVMAGNIPLVGFHDFFCILMSGNIINAKLSSDDNILLPAMIDILLEINEEFSSYINIVKDKLHSFDAIIATGSDNTSRYFEYYFGKYPNIIRKTRNSVAIINGNERPEDLTNLGKDIFMYYGLGCRSVSKIYVPENYNFDKLYKSIFEYKFVVDNIKYRNNYDYNKSVYLINSVKFLDNNFLMIKEDASMHSPVSVLNFEYFNNKSLLNSLFAEQAEQLQCIVSVDNEIDNSILPGNSQKPDILDYADNVDTTEFLLSLA